MIYFTSDLHLGHSGIIAMRNRPFADVEEMNRTLISNFNAVVHKDDTVYILGDLAHHMQVGESYNLQNREEGLLRYDVGVDANQYCPVSVKQILQFFDKR